MLSKLMLAIHKYLSQKAIGTCLDPLLSPPPCHYHAIQAHVVWHDSAKVALDYHNHMMTLCCLRATHERHKNALCPTGLHQLRCVDVITTIIKDSVCRSPR